MRRIRTGVWAAGVLALAAAAAGCSGDPKLVPVTGTVKLDGKPVEGVRVYFWPTDMTAKSFQNRMAIGFSDKTGRFALKGTNGDGIATGDYKVTFARPMARGKASDPNLKAEETGAHETLKPEYTDQDKTKQTATVSEASHDFVFELSTK
ncbi:MAG TPA: hypothetical protein VGF55_04660 [Gemmataceae bacterium]|jgi:hypothetical protein